LTGKVIREKNASFLKRVMLVEQKGNLCSIASQGGESDRPLLNRENRQRSGEKNSQEPEGIPTIIPSVGEKLRHPKD